MSDGLSTPAGPTSTGPQQPIATTSPVSERHAGDGTAAGPATTGPGPITEPASGWVGWVYFAGIMLLMLGAFQLIEGLTALFNRPYLLVTSRGLLVTVDLATWGWLHLIIAAVALVAGWGVMVGKRWAQVLGIVLAAVSAVVNLTYIAAYPLWSVVVITVDVIVIYALAVHGREVRHV
jgi:hypothetical protein